MDLFERSLHYMLEIMQGKRTPPAGMNITAEDEEERARQVGEQAAAMGVEALPHRMGRRCPRSCFNTIPTTACPSATRSTPYSTL